MSKRPLAPGFINRLDAWLLKNKPDTWSTRIHMLIYYWILFVIVLSGLSFLIPDNPLQPSNIYFWVMATSVLVIVAIVVWIIYLVRFNTFKSYGTVHIGDRIKTYVLYFISLVLICTIVWIPPIIETYKTMIRYSPSTVAEDMNEMNVLLARLVKEEVDAEITVDSIFIIDYSTYIPSNPSGTYTWDDSLGAYVKTPIYLSRDELKWTLNEQDSVIWISNDKLLRFQVTNLRFLTNYEIEEDADVHMLTSFEIYNKVYKDSTKYDLQALQRQYFEIAEKYIDPSNDYGSYWDYSNDPSSVAAYKYKTSAVSNGMYNICSRLYRYDDNDMNWFLHSIYYVAMFISLCVFIFRHSTMRTFFLSILTGIILAILTGIIAIFANFDEEGLMTAAILYFVLFLVVAFSTIHLRTRSVFTGIALNLAVVCTPFIPFICVLLYYQLHRFDYYDDPYFYYDSDVYQEYHEREKLMYKLSEAFGFVLLLVMIETVYKWMFRKWYAAPEE